MDNDEQGEAEEKHLQFLQDQYSEDIRILMALPAGRRFLKGFFNWCDILAIYPGQNSGIYFHEGHRNCGKKIWEDVCEADPLEAAKLMVELTTEGKEVTNDSGSKRRG